MTSYEFSESMAFEQLEPDPAEMTMHLVSVLLTWFANVHRDTKSKPEPFTVDDFLPNQLGPSKAERQAAFAATMADFARHQKERSH